MIRDNIKTGGNITMNGDKFTDYKSIDVIQLADDPINDIWCHEEDLDMYIVRLVVHNGEVFGLGVYRESSSSYIGYSITTKIDKGLRTLIFTEGGFSTDDDFVIISHNGLVHLFTIRNSKACKYVLYQGDSNFYVGNSVSTTTQINGTVYINAVVYDDILYSLNSSDLSYFAPSYIHMWSGENCNVVTSVAVSPYYFTNIKSSVVYGGCIHIISSIYTKLNNNVVNSGNYHYIWDKNTNTWSLLETVLPLNITSNHRYNDVYVYHNDLFFKNYIYKNGVWINLGVTRHDNAIIFPVSDTEIHALIGDMYSDMYSNKIKHYSNYGGIYRCTIEK